MQGISNIAAYFKQQLLLILFFLPLFTSAQQNLYDSDLLTPAFHKDRREALRKLMHPGSCAVFFANPVRNRTNDVDFQYAQDPDFYYLTGLTEPHAILIISQDSFRYDGNFINEVLFIQDRDSARERWDGIRLGVEGAKRLGIEKVYVNRRFRDEVPDFQDFDKILVKFPTDIKESASGKTNLNVLVHKLKSALQESGKESQSAPLLKMMATLREIKSVEEIALLQKAIDITNEGLAEAIRAVKPGMKEYQAQAIVEYFFKHGGAEYPGYGSISGSGLNSCVLHYVTNRKQLDENDLLLMDMGAEYHGYTADVTRTVPVDGTFSQEQAAIYNLVLKAQLAGIEKCRPGNGFYDPHKEAFSVISKGLLELGIAKTEEETKFYFNHGTSHYLGLEVHDPGNYGPLKTGMVLTVEPGIYIPQNSPCDKKWWNIGVRIEDDVLITENGYKVLSQSLAKQITDIELLMKEPALFDKVK